MTENATKTVLVVGGTGRLGSKLVEALRAKEGVSVRLLVRPGSGRASSVSRGGVELVQGDLRDAESLDWAVKGVDAIVSAVNGGPDVVVDGQRALLAAAKRHGVRRFIPSDFSVNYFRLDYGDNLFLDDRKRFAEALQQSGVGYTFMLSGGFMEVMLSPFMSIFDFEAGVATPWGTGDEPIEMTTTDDVARYTAEAVFDPRAENRAVELAGDVASVKQIAAVYQEVTGRRLEVRPRGTVEDLRRWIAERKATAKSPFEYVPAQYQLAQVSGKGALHHLVNGWYPHLRPITVRQALSEQLRARAA